MSTMWRVLLGFLCAFIVALGPASAYAESSYSEIGRDLEPLRSEFDANQGKVRAVLLVAPT